MIRNAALKEAAEEARRTNLYVDAIAGADVARRIEALASRPASPQGREYLLLASYCGDEGGCTKQRPCNDCLAMCNIFDENGSFIRELGQPSEPASRPASPIQPSEREAIVAYLRCLKGWATGDDYDALGSIINAIARGDHLSDHLPKPTAEGERE